MKQEDWITLTLWKFLSLVVWKGGSYTARIFLWHILTPIWLAYETLCFFIVIVCFFKTVFISLALYELMFDLHLSDTVTMRFRSMILDRMCGSCGGWIFFFVFFAPVSRISVLTQVEIWRACVRERRERYHVCASTWDSRCHI